MKTNNTVYLDAAIDDDTRRARLYQGQLFLQSPTEESLAMVAWARTFLEEAFAPLDPIEAQHSIDVYKFVDIFGPVKPKFIHHPKTIELLRALIARVGVDMAQTYLDVPRLRGVTSDAYLTAGVGYAHPMHRDTWWSAPLQQINWWMPIYPFESESSMAFHPDWWDQPTDNGSEEFDYYVWNTTGRAEAAKHVKEDTRKQPKIAEPVAADPQVRFVIPPGGLILFSGAQMHSTVPNTSGLSRFSIDFSTVNLADVLARGGAANVDSFPKGTSLRDFTRAADGAPMPAEAVTLYDDREVDESAAVFKPVTTG